MIKKVTIILLVLLFVMGLTACGGQPEASNEETLQPEIAMIIDGETVNDNSFNQVTWESIKAYCGEKQIGCEYYDADKQTNEVYLQAVDRAVEAGNKLVIMSGVQFASAVYDAQNKYPDIKFLLIDGIPCNEKNEYVTADNTVSILFSEEEAGYLAGYAAIFDGYRHLGFMGGMDVPAVERYGYGFVQGASHAAAMLDIKADMSYKYSGTFEAKEEVEADALSWYMDGTEVIFACGGNMNKSVFSAAEKSMGKVIGVDTDQSALSETVITTAEKNLGKAVENVLKNYARDNFGGGSVFNYGARNGGVALEMVNSRFNTFDAEHYAAVLKLLEEGKIDLKKDTDVESVAKLGTRNLKIKME